MRDPIQCVLLTLSHGGAMLGNHRVEALRRAALSLETVLLYDEVDVDEDGVLTHRLLLYPCEEVTLDFRDFALLALPRGS